MCLSPHQSFMKVVEIRNHHMKKHSKKIETMEGKEVADIIPNEVWKDGDWPNYKLMVNVPHLDDVYTLILGFIMLSIIRIILSIAVREGRSVILVKLSKVLSVRLCSILIGFVIAVSHRLIEGRSEKSYNDFAEESFVEDYLLIIEYIIVFNSVMTMYSKLFFVQIVPILTYGILGTYVLLALMTTLNYAIVRFMFDDEENEIPFGQILAFTSVLCFNDTLFIHSFQCSYADCTYDQVKNKKDQDKKDQDKEDRDKFSHDAFVFQTDQHCQTPVKYLPYYYLLLGYKFTANLGCMQMLVVGAQLNSFGTSFEVIAIVILAAILKIILSIILGVIAGVTTTFIARLTKHYHDHENSFYDPFLMVIGTLLSFFLASFLNLSRALATAVCGFIQARYMYQNIDAKYVVAIKTFFRILALETEQALFIFVGYRAMYLIINETWNLKDGDADLNFITLFLVSMLGLYVFRFLVISSITILLNKLEYGRANIKMQALLVLGAMRSPLAVAMLTYVIHRIGHGRKPDSMFSPAATLVVVTCTLIDSIVAKYLARSVILDEESGDSVPENKTFKKFSVQFMKKEKMVHHILVDAKSKCCD